VNRTSLYRTGKAKEPGRRELREIEAMNRMDEIYTAHPYYGCRRIHAVLKAEGFAIGREHVLHLMHRMGIRAVCPGRNLSRLYQRQYTRPYLLKGLAVTRPDQVWAVDITYIRMSRGYMYLFVIIDVYSRYVVGWELSSTLEKEFVLACLERAYAVRVPEIQNSDQGAHFTNADYTALLEGNGIRISMDGRRRALDNIFVERFFRTLKYEEIYLNAYAGPRDLRKALRKYIAYYNDERPHQSLGYKSPKAYYRPDRLVKIQIA
jgi:putative transposase